MPSDYTSRHIFRMIHHNNLEFILTNGLHSQNSSIHDPNYIDIGNPLLITQRQTHSIPIDPPGGYLGDYIPFYFGGHSPMLLNIKTGYGGIPKKPQEDLIFLVCRIADIITTCPHWCFTDGHAKNHLTEFYNTPEDLQHINWQTVRSQYWHNTEDDMDRMRQKQAEFLVKDHVPISCISAIIVKTQNREQEVQSLLDKCNLEKTIYIDKKHYYFYP